MALDAKDLAIAAIKFEKDADAYIRQYLTAEEIEFAQVDYRVETMVFDLYLEKGCAAFGWGEKTVVEFKYTLMPDSIYKVAQSMLQWRKRNDQSIVPNQIVLIYKPHDPLTQAASEVYTPNGIQIYSWIGFKRFVSNRIKEGLTKKAEKPSIKPSVLLIKSNADIREKNQEKIVENAHHAFSNERVTLFLGAGVSVDAGLPTWDTLLDGMFKPRGKKPFDYITEQNSKAIVDACANSSIVVGRYAFNGYGNMSKFSERIKEVLYGNVHDSELVNTLCNVIASDKGKENITHVITYNYDDLIETGLEEIGYDEYYSIYGKNRDATKRLPIYHVHGMISQRDITSTPILSEKDYHDLYKNSHNWANVVQLYALNNTTCFFIGLSMSDPNLRRLLDFSRSDEGISRTEKDVYPHYVFLRKEKLKKESRDEVNEEHWDKQEYMMKEFGINIIWYNDFPELPGLIRRVMM